MVIRGSQGAVETCSGVMPVLIQSATIDQCPIGLASWLVAIWKWSGGKDGFVHGEVLDGRRVVPGHFKLPQISHRSKRTKFAFG